MMAQTVKKLVFLFLIVILANCGAFGLQLESVRITAARKTIEVGEPLVIKIIDKYQEPVIGLHRPFPHTLRITVEDLEGGKEPSVYTVRPNNVHSNLERTEFICSIMLWYDFRGGYSFPLIFTKPGKYEVYLDEVYLIEKQRTSSNKLNINVVQASPETMAARALLSDPKDMKFLRSHQLGAKNRPARIAKLLEVVKQSDTTTTAQHSYISRGTQDFN